jgi:hypothetical protein
MKDVFDQTGELPAPEDGCDQDLGEMVNVILQAFYD